jgi:demethylmenaquinone methyltransferase/2-methoxy-6-polyprenyl-1,4-benzoquinol methylase
VTTPSREKIWKMFDAIAPTYDRVNRVMTFGMDQRWRKKVGDFLPKGENLSLLDCATGTGDQMLALNDKVSSAIGIDLAEDMLKIGRAKLVHLPHISFQTGNMCALDFPDGTFDCATVSFGIRNVTDVPGALREMHRVLKPGGRALILEGSMPSNWLIRKGHLLYLRHLLPRIGGLLSKNRDAYRYLNKTIETFPCGDAFCTLMRTAGFSTTTAHPIFFGSVTLYVGEKR